MGEWTEKTKLIFHAKVWLLGKRVILVVWPDISILTLIEAELHSTNSGHRLIGFILSWKNLIMTEKKKKFVIPTHIKQTRASYLQVSEHGMLEL